MANTPIDTLRDGNIKATIWANFGEKGTFYTVDISRTYQDASGTFHDSHSFSGAELLRVSRLADNAYTEIGIHRQNDRMDAANQEAA